MRKPRSAAAAARLGRGWVRRARRRGAARALLLVWLGALACGGAADPPAAGGERPDPTAWLRIEAGRQCELDEARRAALRASAREALAAAGTPARAIHVGASLAELPPRCRPEGGREGLAARARRAGQEEAARRLVGIACAACGCPQAWLVCAEMAPDEAPPSALGYLPARGGA